MGDVLYVSEIGYFVLLGNYEPTTSDAKAMKYGLDFVMPPVLVGINYILRTNYGTISREYEKKGKVTLHTSTPITVEIS